MNNPFTPPSRSDEPEQTARAVLGKPAPPGQPAPHWRAARPERMGRMIIQRYTGFRTASRIGIQRQAQPQPGWRKLNLVLVSRRSKVSLINRSPVEAEGAVPVDTEPLEAEIVEGDGGTAEQAAFRMPEDIATARREVALQRALAEPGELPPMTPAIKDMLVRRLEETRRQELAARQSEPAARQSEPAAQQIEPTAEQSEAAAQKSEPAVQRSDLASQVSEPAAQEPGPAAAVAASGSIQRYPVPRGARRRAWKEEFTSQAEAGKKPPSPAPVQADIRRSPDRSENRPEAGPAERPEPEAGLGETYPAGDENTAAEEDHEPFPGAPPGHGPPGVAQESQPETAAVTPEIHRKMPPPALRDSAAQGPVRSSTSPENGPPVQRAAGITGSRASLPAAEPDGTAEPSTQQPVQERNAPGSFISPAETGLGLQPSMPPEPAAAPGISLPDGQRAATLPDNPVVLRAASPVETLLVPASTRPAEPTQTSLDENAVVSPPAAFPTGSGEAAPAEPGAPAIIQAAPAVSAPSVSAPLAAAPPTASSSPSAPPPVGTSPAQSLVSESSLSAPSPVLAPPTSPSLSSTAAGAADLHLLTPTPALPALPGEAADQAPAPGMPGQTASIQRQVTLETRDGPASTSLENSAAGEPGGLSISQGGPSPARLEPLSPAATQRLAAPTRTAQSGSLADSGQRPPSTEPSSALPAISLPHPEAPQVERLPGAAEEPQEFSAGPGLASHEQADTADSPISSLPQSASQVSAPETVDRHGSGAHPIQRRGTAQPELPAPSLQPQTSQPGVTVPGTSPAGVTEPASAPQAVTPRPAGSPNITNASIEQQSEVVSPAQISPREILVSSLASRSAPVLMRKETVFPKDNASSSTSQADEDGSSTGEAPGTTAALPAARQRSVPQPSARSEAAPAGAERMSPPGPQAAVPMAVQRAPVPGSQAAVPPITPLQSGAPGLPGSPVQTASPAIQRAPADQEQKPDWMRVFSPIDEGQTSPRSSPAASIPTPDLAPVAGISHTASSGDTPLQREEVITPPATGSPPPSESTPPTPPIDYPALARAVYPLIRRILAEEKERQFGRR